MRIGTFGAVPFYVEDKGIQTFQNLTWKSSASYGSHKLHLQTEQIEFTGKAADEASFDMTLSAMLGVNPMEAMELLHAMLENGQVAQLVLGTSVIGTKWVVSGLSRAFDYVYKDGTPLSCTVTVTIKEYV